MQRVNFIKELDNLFVELEEKIDFKDGQLEKYIKEKPVLMGIIEAYWKKNVKLALYVRQRGKSYYCVTRNGEAVYGTFYTAKFDDAFFINYQKLVNQVANGDFDFKKNISDKVADVIRERGLTGYMNDTKWEEFLYAMTEEMPIAVPYDYKTLFDEEPEKLRLGTAYDVESFNWYHFKSLEWVKVKPKFYELVYKGRLMENEKIYHDVEAEFLGLMDKYSIYYEYDAEDEVYVIYGYK